MEYAKRIGAVTLCCTIACILVLAVAVTFSWSHKTPIPATIVKLQDRLDAGRDRGTTMNKPMVADVLALLAAPAAAGEKQDMQQLPVISKEQVLIILDAMKEREAKQPPAPPKKKPARPAPTRRKLADSESISFFVCITGAEKSMGAEACRKRAKAQAIAKHKEIADDYCADHGGCDETLPPLLYGF
jgi:hypothetical protein